MNRLLICVVSITTIFVMGCSKKDKSAAEKSSQVGKPGTEGLADKGAINANTPVPADDSLKGRFRVSVKKPESVELLPIYDAMTEEKFFEAIVAELNEEYKVPMDVTIGADECQEENAFYDPEARSVTLCYELFGLIEELLADDEMTEDELGEATMGAVMFIFFHEVGHALVHVLDLPVTGKEEDAVDQLATLVLIDSGDFGITAAVNGARFFIESSDSKPLYEELAFADEHSLDEQRFYNILCWVRGGTDEQLEELDDIIPEDRLVQCPQEYANLERSWDTLLAPHLREAR